jgi:hypothetical protein
MQLRTRLKTFFADNAMPVAIVAGVATWSALYEYAGVFPPEAPLTIEQQSCIAAQHRYLSNLYENPDADGVYRALAFVVDRGMSVLPRQARDFCRDRSPAP